MPKKKSVEDKPLPPALLKSFFTDKAGPKPPKKRMPNGDSKKGCK